MNSVELVISICKDRNIPISKLERACDFSNGYIKRLKEGKFPSNRLQKIAEYLDVPIGYLLTGDEKYLNARADGQPEWYFDSDAAREAQEMFEDDDMRALFHMKRNMNHEKFKAHMDMMKQLYRLEHPEDHPEDYE